MRALLCEKVVQNDGLRAGMSVSHTNLVASVLDMWIMKCWDERYRPAVCVDWVIGVLR